MHIGGTGRYAGPFGHRPHAGATEASFGDELHERPPDQGGPVDARRRHRAAGMSKVMPVSRSESSHSVSRSLGRLEIGRMGRRTAGPLLHEAGGVQLTALRLRIGGRPQLREGALGLAHPDPFHHGVEEALRASLTIVGCRALRLQVGVRVAGMCHQAGDRSAGGAKAAVEFEREVGVGLASIVRMPATDRTRRSDGGLRR